ncbi:MAG: hypothetical protein NTZ49_01930 [Candidatus Parcubacteria bacterium]|nr:hypothetical protein [Candidatus Parcubacteria bacterium]
MDRKNLTEVIPGVLYDTTVGDDSPLLFKTQPDVLYDDEGLEISIIVGDFELKCKSEEFNNKTQLNFHEPQELQANLTTILTSIVFSNNAEDSDPTWKYVSKGMVGEIKGTAASTAKETEDAAPIPMPPLIAEEKPEAIPAPPADEEKKPEPAKDPEPPKPWDEEEEFEDFPDFPVDEGKKPEPEKAPEFPRPGEEEDPFRFDVREPEPERAPIPPRPREDWDRPADETDDDILSHRRPLPRREEPPEEEAPMKRGILTYILAAIGIILISAMLILLGLFLGTWWGQADIDRLKADNGKLQQEMKGLKALNPQIKKLQEDIVILQQDNRLYKLKADRYSQILTKLLWPIPDDSELQNFDVNNNFCANWCQWLKESLPLVRQDAKANCPACSKPVVQSSRNTNVKKAVAACPTCPPATCTNCVERDKIYPTTPQQVQTPPEQVQSPPPPQPQPATENGPRTKVYPGTPAPGPVQQANAPAPESNTTVRTQTIDP